MRLSPLNVGMVLALIALTGVMAGCRATPHEPPDAAAAATKAARRATFAVERFTVVASYLVADMETDLRDFALDHNDAAASADTDAAAGVRLYNRAFRILAVKLHGTRSRYVSLAPPGDFARFDALFREALSVEQRAIAEADGLVEMAMPVASQAASLAELAQRTIDQVGDLLQRARDELWRVATAGAGTTAP